MIRNWQIAHQEYLDGALIAGDLGLFPDLEKVDKATRKWMERDAEEAGFSRYFTRPEPGVERLFTPEYGEFSDVRCPIYFVPGNHEDYDFLNSKQIQTGNQPVAVDCYGKFCCISDGSVTKVGGLRVAGIWGIEHTVPNAPYRINPASIRKLESMGKGQFDILLTHDTPADAHPLGGSLQIANLIRACQPDIHLFGHIHPVDGQHEFRAPKSRTKSVILKEVSFGKELDKNLLGVMGILSSDAEGINFSLILDDWLKQMRHQTWEQVLPAAP